MRIGYADPPYPGQAAKHYAEHVDYAGEVDHLELLKRLDAEYDGWVLHTSSVALAEILGYATSLRLTYRVVAWVKPFAAFKRNVSVGYAWEPILVKPCRKPVVSGRITPLRDYIAQSITMRKGLTGVKPELVCHWLFETLGARPEDDLHDIFPGTGAVTAAWLSWRKLFVLPMER